MAFHVHQVTHVNLVNGAVVQPVVEKHVSNQSFFMHVSKSQQNVTEMNTLTFVFMFELCQNLK